MNKEEILLNVLNEHGDFENVRQQFDENDLACILEAMERYKGKSLPIDSVIVCSDCKFNGMQPMNNSPCDMYNASEQTCSNYNKL